MKAMTKMITRKVMNSVITLFLVIILNFALFRLMPGNPVNVMVPSDPRISAEYKQHLIEEYGLNDSMYIQFFTYIKNALFFKFGDSFADPGTSAMSIVLSNMRWTLILAGTSSILMIVIGTAIGIASAWKRGSLFDSGSLAFTLFFYAMPTFWLSMMLIAVFARGVGWFPDSGALRFGTRPEWTWTSFVDLARHLVLPAASLTVGAIGEFALIMRSSLIDVMTEDYITTARAKGLRERDVMRYHAVPNAMLPMVALIAITLAFVVGGVFQTEIVFNYPGVGYLTIKATYDLNYPILQAAFFLIAVMVIIANFIADLVLMMMDPRISVG
jgi:peptide/nickel transport system permease protein